MKEYKTKIHGNEMAIHVICFRLNHENTVLSNNIKWLPGSKPGYFIIPENLMPGMFVDIIIQGKYFSGGKRLRLSKKTPKRLVWEFIQNIDSKIEPLVPTRAQVLLQRAAEIRRKKHDSEMWFRNLMMDLNILGAIWNYPVIDQFIIDFAWPSERVAVEIDGEYHENAAQKKYDAQREAKIKRAGWKLVRISYPKDDQLIEKIHWINDALWSIRHRRIDDRFKYSIEKSAEDKSRQNSPANDRSLRTS